MRTPPPGAIVSAIRHMDYSSLPRLIRLITRLALRASGAVERQVSSARKLRGPFPCPGLLFFLNARVVAGDALKDAARFLLEPVAITEGAGCIKNTGIAAIDLGRFTFLMSGLLESASTKVARFCCIGKCEII